MPCNRRDLSRPWYASFESHYTDFLRVRDRKRTYVRRRSINRRSSRSSISTFKSFRLKFILQRRLTMNPVRLRRSTGKNVSSFTSKRFRSSRFEGGVGWGVGRLRQMTDPKENRLIYLNIGRIGVKGLGRKTFSSPHPTPSPLPPSPRPSILRSEMRRQ